MSGIVLAAHSRPSLASRNVKQPLFLVTTATKAQRKPPAAWIAGSSPAMTKVENSLRLASGNKREAERRQTLFNNHRTSGCGSRHG
jgi:hypothetical protein